MTEQSTISRMLSSESAHWYLDDGTPFHTVIGKNGKERPTTIRDAKEKGANPSVTSITGILDRPPLTAWKVDKTIRKAYENPRFDGESMDDYVVRIAMLGKEEAGEAADLGTRIHDILEQSLRVGWYKGPADDETFMPGYHSFKAIVEYMEEQGLRPIAYEKRLVHRSGFAGTSDMLYLDTKTGNLGIWDHKTKRTKEKQKVIKPYPEQVMQIAAYWNAAIDDEDICRAVFDVSDKELHCAPTGINCFISTTEPGRVEFYEHKQEDLKKAWDNFKRLFKVWKYLKGYDPQSSRKNK